ncbi:MAG: hypothetical protein ICV83_00335 [Cytophagales bacterium]|nr:hypothetical protein [Cytophagales bacterium]
MKSFIFCTSYINNSSEEFSRLRYRKWIDNYNRLADQLGVEYLFLIDDGSADAYVGDDVAVISHLLPDTLSHRVNLVHFPDNLGRRSENDYAGWWRSFAFSWEVARKYHFEKIIHVESDFFVLSQALLDFIRNRNNGWTGLFSSYYNFPESAIQVIVKDAFPSLGTIYQRAVQSNYRFSGIAERTLPFTDVVKHFRGDRLGEIVVLKQWVKDKTYCLPAEVDYVGQLPTVLPVPDAKDVQRLIHAYASTLVE